MVGAALACRQWGVERIISQRSCDINIRQNGNCNMAYHRLHVSLLLEVRRNACDILRGSRHWRTYRQRSCSEYDMPQPVTASVHRFAMASHHEGGDPGERLLNGTFALAGRVLCATCVDQTRSKLPVRPRHRDGSWPVFARQAYQVSNLVGHWRLPELPERRRARSSIHDLQMNGRHLPLVRHLSQYPSGFAIVSP
jgi:hypothetical protein